jgi:hypothetical protein
MKNLFCMVILLHLFSIGCTTTSRHLLKIDTTPSDALISVHDKNESSAVSTRKVAGTTPVEKEFSFPSESSSLWLEIEKRGYVSKWVEITSDTGPLTVALERMKDNSDEPVREFAFPAVKRLLFAIPAFEVIKRGFSSESHSMDESMSAKTGLAKGANAYFAGKYEVAQIGDTQDDTQLLKAAWRDVKTAIELIDPIRLKYLSMPQYLETKSSREAARQLGAHHDAEALLVLSGIQNLETAGMVMGKMGLHAAGTAVSYGSSYSNAVARGDSFFIYTIYVPHFSEGTLINAALIDCMSGEILWLNRGLWDPVNFADSEAVKRILNDLLSGIN